MQLFQCAFYLNQSTWYLLVFWEMLATDLEGSIATSVVLNNMCFYTQKTCLVDVITSYYKYICISEHKSVRKFSVLALIGPV